MDVDIGSSSVAASVTNLVCGATKSLTIDLGVLVEGQSPDQLPEQLLGTIRYVLGYVVHQPTTLCGVGVFD